VADTFVKPIELAVPAGEVGQGPPSPTIQPVQRRIVGPLRLHPSPRISPARPVLVAKPDINVELTEVKGAWRIYRSHPGETFQYEVRIPAAVRQRPGMFWYHPHAHGFVNDQILGGMSGGLVVDGFEQLFPLVQRLPERFCLIKHLKIGEENEVVSVNGQVNPAIAMRAGEMQFWRIAHIGASQFFKFRIEGMPLYVVATDGHALSQPRKVTEFFIGPGERVDAIAIGPAPGEYAMRTISFQNEAWRPPEPVLPVAVIISSGSTAPDAGLENEVLRQRVVGPQWIDEVRAAATARRRTLVYSKTADRKVFMIDGRMIDERRSRSVGQVVGKQ